jgi:hypothetical protein
MRIILLNMSKGMVLGVRKRERRHGLHLRGEKKAKQETKQAADRTLLATSEYIALKPPR